MIPWMRTSREEERASTASRTPTVESQAGQEEEASVRGWGLLKGKLLAHVCVSQIAQQPVNVTHVGIRNGGRN